MLLLIHKDYTQSFSFSFGSYTCGAQPLAALLLLGTSVFINCMFC